MGRSTTTRLLLIAFLLLLAIKLAFWLLLLQAEEPIVFGEFAPGVSDLFLFLSLAGDAGILVLLALFISRPEIFVARPFVIQGLECGKHYKSKGTFIVEGTGNSGAEALRNLQRTVALQEALVDVLSCGDECEKQVIKNSWDLTPGAPQHQLGVGWKVIGLLQYDVEVKCVRQ